MHGKLNISPEALNMSDEDRKRATELARLHEKEIQEAFGITPAEMRENTMAWMYDGRTYRGLWGQRIRSTRTLRKFAKTSG